MQNTSFSVIDRLDISQLDNIIISLEQSLEMDKLEYLATKDPDTRTRISDTCFFLSILYCRRQLRGA